MEAFYFDLPNFDQIEVHVFADLHIGDKQADLQLIKDRVEYIKNTPNAYFILNGDIINMDCKTSVSDIESRTMNIMEQVYTARELFAPISDKCLCSIEGNHERRSYKQTGISASHILANLIGCENWASGSAVLFVRFGHLGTGNPTGHPERKREYVLYATHGNGGGAKVGGKANKMLQMSEVVEGVDVFIHSHTHTSLVIKDAVVRADKASHSIYTADRLYVNNGATLDYGGYGEEFGFRPNSKTSPVVILNANWKLGAEAYV